MTSPAELLALASDPQRIIDELLRRDFVSFVIRAYPFLRGGADLKPNWHMSAIAYQLDRITDGQNRRLIVTLPPRALKSMMISALWVAWSLGRDRTLNFVCVSYALDLSNKQARDCRAVMQSDWYQRLFPHTRIRVSRSAVHDFETTAGGGRLATSITGTLTGRGGDIIIIIDDPIKPDEALSDTVREACNDWFSSTLASRLNDKKKGAIIVIMQRLHPYDLVGMLQEQGGWDELSLPAIAQEDQHVPLTRGRVHIRKVVDVLHPEHEPLEVLMSIQQTMGSLLFAAQYLQQPVPLLGNLVKRNWLATYTTPPERTGNADRIVQSWDTASEQGTFTDYSVCVTALVRGRNVWLLHVWRGKVQFPDLVKKTIELATEFKATELLIEKASSGRQLLQQLWREPVRGVPDPIACKPEGDKQSRFSGVSAMIEAGRLSIPKEAPWLGTFLAELLAFPTTRHDDQVDALTQLLIWVQKREAYDTYGIPAGPMILEPSDLAIIRGDQSY